jgi:hypothetical protein
MDELKERYWSGNRNKVIRYYYYVRRGLELLNEFRYLLMAIFGVYLAMKMSNPILLIFMFLVSIPVLIVLGWLMVHHISKVIEWLNVEFSTYWGRYTYDLQEKILEELKRIREGVER